MPDDLPPWAAVHQQAMRWLRAGCFEALASDLREVLRVAAGRAPQPTAAVLDSRTLRSTPESGGRAGYDGHKRKKGSKVHLAVDTLGHLLALRVTPANENDRAAVSALAEAVQEATGDNVDLAWVDQGYEGERPAEAAAAHGIRLEVVKLPQPKRGFVLLPRRWVVERSFAWATRCRRLVRDYERLHTTLAGSTCASLLMLNARAVWYESRLRGTRATGPPRSPRTRRRGWPRRTMPPATNLVATTARPPG